MVKLIRNYIFELISNLIEPFLISTTPFHRRSKRGSIKIKWRSREDEIGKLEKKEREREILDNIKLPKKSDRENEFLGSVEL